ncbi:hypothetical protein [Salinilacihabitans rarus]|uniref:hypothetical protein n=1 Tax=Salinilacihabitans rarus TaxID=2961596 RepID=UPI0020C843E5|nr:hypothetical protein [Salinilacihabitans rarus]
MKRTITITLAVAMIASLMAVGLAGTAAAQDGPMNNVDDGLIDIDFGDQTSGDAVNIAEVNQENNNNQIGTASAEATATAVSDGDHHKSGDGATAGASATATVSQGQSVEQVNVANIDQEADTGNEQEVEFDVSLDLEPVNAG